MAPENTPHVNNEHAIVDLLDRIETIKKHKLTANLTIIYLSKAFDTLSLDILIDKLNHYNIGIMHWHGSQTTLQTDHIKQNTKMHTQKPWDREQEFHKDPYLAHSFSSYTSMT